MKKQALAHGALVGFIAGLCISGWPYFPLSLAVIAATLLACWGVLWVISNVFWWP